MPIKKVKPTNNARRKLTYQVYSIDKVKPAKSLTFGIKKSSGRNHEGQLVVAHKGGGAKRKYRIIDFSMAECHDKKAKVESLQYDPNRSANIALLSFEDGEKAYILAPEGLKKGSNVVCADKAAPRIGNRMKLRNIPIATQVYNIELSPGKGGQICRSAGSYATVLGIDGNNALLRLMSGEVRNIPADNYASIGIASNIDHSKVIIGKAGRTRHMGIKPTVLGKSKNPKDHPHGGGEGHSPIGLKYPKTPWGAPALGRRTRNVNKPSSKLIVARRKK